MVLTRRELLDRQIHGLTEVGCIRIFSDKKSGKNAEREELWKALDYLREGDTLVVPSLDRLVRPENTVTSIAKLLGVFRNTIYNYVPELKGGHLALAEATSTPGLPQPTRSED